MRSTATLGDGWPVSGCRFRDRAGFGPATWEDVL